MQELVYLEFPGIRPFEEKPDHLQSFLLRESQKSRFLYAGQSSFPNHVCHYLIGRIWSGTEFFPDRKLASRVGIKGRKHLLKTTIIAFGCRIINQWIPQDDMIGQDFLLRGIQSFERRQQKPVCQILPARSFPINPLHRPNQFFGQVSPRRFRHGSLSIPIRQQVPPGLERCLTQSALDMIVVDISKVAPYFFYRPLERTAERAGKKRSLQAIVTVEGPGIDRGRILDIFVDTFLVPGPAGLMNV